MKVRMALRKAATITPHLVHMLIVLLASGCCVRTTGQHLPTRDELDFQLHRNHPEIFYDTKLLPDGAEVTSYVLKRVSTRYFFLVDVGNVPLTIGVTPCSSVVSMTILWRTMPEDEDYYEDEYIAYDTEEPDELWHQASARQQGVSELAETLLISKTGSDRLTYYNRSAAPGLYSVVVVATRKDTSLRLYASTTPHSDAVYPPLPADPVVRVTAASREAISFAWKPAPATSSASAVQFCISVSALRHFRSQCAAHAHRYGDPEPPPPPYAGFGFAKERGRRRRGRKNGRRTPSTSPPPVTTARPDGDDSGVLECIGTATNYIYREPNVGRKYYIDVYAVNVVTNASMSYDGASVKVPRRSSSRSPGRLAVDRSSRVVLKTSRPEKTFKYRVTGRQPASLNIYVRSCEMPPPAAVRVQLEREADGEVLATHVVTESLEQALHVDSLAPGSYRVKMVTADGRRPPSGRRYRWTVLVSTGDGSPYPQLPADARVRPASGNATDDCRSTTVQWPVAAATEAQRYCVYLEPVTTASSARLNVCVKSRRRRRKSIRVSCHVVPAATDDVELRRTNETMVQVISNMTPGRRYAVDVFASTVTTTTTAAAAPTKELLAYERLIVDVPNTC